MALNETALNAMANHLASLGIYVAMHTADPGTTGANPSSAARQPLAWNVAVTGGISISVAENFTGGASSGPCTHAGLWSAVTGGTFYGGFPLTGDLTFNAAGEYILDSLNINGSAS